MTTDTTNEEPGNSDSRTADSLDPPVREDQGTFLERIEKMFTSLQTSIDEINTRIESMDKRIEIDREDINDRLHDLERKIQRRNSDDEVEKYFKKFAKPAGNEYPLDFQVPSPRSTRGEGLLEIDTIDRPPFR